MPASAIRAGQAYVELTTRDAAFVRGLNLARAKLNAFSAGVADLGRKLVAVSAVGVGAGLFGLRAYAKLGDTMDKMSKRTGLGAEALSELMFAAEQSGTDIASVEIALKRMAATILDAQQGLATARRSFDALGLSVNHLRGLRPEDQFTLITDRLNQIADPTMKAAVALEIFGRSGTMILPMLNDMRALRAEARSLGLVLNESDVRAAAELNDAMNRLRRTLMMVAVRVGQALTPTVMGMIAALVRGAVTAAQWVQAHRPLIVAAFHMALRIGAVGTAFLGVAAGIKVVAMGLGTITGAFALARGAISVVVSLVGALASGLLMLANPIGIVVGGLAALVAGMAYAGGYGGKLLAWLGDRFGGFRQDATDALGGIQDALMAGDIGLAAEVLWAGLRVIWQRGVNALIAGWVVARDFFVGHFLQAYQGGIGLMLDGIALVRKAWEKATHYFAFLGPNIQAVQRSRSAEKQYDIDVAQAKATISDPRALSVRLQQLKTAHAERQMQIARETQAALDGQEAAHQEKLKQIDLEHVAALEALRDEAKADDALRAAGSAAEIAEGETRLAELRAQLAALITRAKEARTAAERPGMPTPHDFKFKVPDIAGELNRVQRQMEARVTFSAAALSQMGVGSSVQDRMAKGIDETSRNTRDLLIEVRQGGGAFE